MQHIACAWVPPPAAPPTKQTHQHGWLHSRLGVRPIIRPQLQGHCCDMSKRLQTCHKACPAQRASTAAQAAARPSSFEAPNNPRTNCKTHINEVQHTAMIYANTHAICHTFISLTRDDAILDVVPNYVQSLLQTGQDAFCRSQVSMQPCMTQTKEHES